MSSGGYNHQEPRSRLVLSKLNLIARFISLGPFFGGLVVGLVLFFLGSQLGVNLNVMIPASLISGVLSAALVMLLGTYIEKHTISSAYWLQRTIDDVTNTLEDKLSSILFEGRLTGTVGSTSGDLHLVGSSSIAIHPVSKELIALKLQQAAVLGTTAGEKLELSKYGYTKQELEAWQDATDRSMRFHLVCFIDVPQYALNEYELYSCRIEDLVVRTLEIASRDTAKNNDIGLARSRFRDLVDNMIAVQTPAKDGGAQISTNRRERLSSSEDSRRFRVEIQDESEPTQNR